MTDLIETAPGAGDLLPAHMLVLTEGFAKEPQYRKLASYLGICPNEHQSGKSRRKPTSRGYGPSMMRKLLHLAACSVKEHNDRYRQLYRFPTGRLGGRDRRRIQSDTEQMSVQKPKPVHQKAKPLPVDAHQILAPSVAGERQIRSGNR